VNRRIKGKPTPLHIPARSTVRRARSGQCAPVWNTWSCCLSALFPSSPFSFFYSTSVMPARCYGQLRVMHITEALHIGFYDKSLATNGWNWWTNHSDTTVSNYLRVIRCCQFTRYPKHRATRVKQTGLPETQGVTLAYIQMPLHQGISHLIMV
jgi:hypothetical protein